MGLLRRFAPRNDSKQVNRLRNKCAMTSYGHAKLVSVSCGLNPSPAFQAPSAQGRQGYTYHLSSADLFVYPLEQGKRSKCW